jgi:hypothetical protein
LARQRVEYTGELSRTSEGDDVLFIERPGEDLSCRRDSQKPIYSDSATCCLSIMSSPDDLNPLHLTPALPPPPGQVSNFANPESLLKWNIVTTTLCLFFVTLSFVLRTYVRAFIKRDWRLEDCK